MSDHRFLKFCLNLSCEKRGPGYWKLNVLNMENEKYKKEIHKIIDNLDNSLNPIDKRECIKRKRKEFSINFSKYQQRSIKKRKKEIEREIQKIETSETEEFDYKKLKQLEAELDSIYDKQSKGAHIRSKAKWVENGEKKPHHTFKFRKATLIIKRNN